MPDPKELNRAMVAKINATLCSIGALDTTKKTILAGANGYEESDKSSKEGFPYLLANFNYTTARDIDIAMLLIVSWAYALSKEKIKARVYIKQEFSRKDNIFATLTHANPEGKINSEAIKKRIDQKPFQEILGIIFGGYRPDSSKNGENIDLHKIKRDVSQNFKNQSFKISGWMAHGGMVLETIKLIYERFGITKTYYEARKELNERENSEDIKNQIVRQWEIHKLAGGVRKPLHEIAEEANQAFLRLQGKKILHSPDGSDGKGASENFVKLFIRYLERRFPELDDVVKIYYYAAPQQRSVLGSVALGEHTKDYLQKAKKLLEKSKATDKIYLVLNQASWVGEDPPRSEGHANLAVICAGHSKLFESASRLNVLATPGGNLAGETDTWNTMNTDHEGHTPVQNDNRNCVNISLGYLDSLMKQIASIKQNLKPGEKLSIELWKQIHGFCAVKIPKPLKMPGSNEETNTILLPPKYIKYLQSMKSINALITEAQKSENKDNVPLQEVAAELIRVKERYLLLNQPIKTFLRDVFDPKEDIEDVFRRIEVELGSDAKVNDLVKLNSRAPRQLTKEKLNEFKACEYETLDDIEEETPLIEAVQPQYEEWLNKELQKPVYKLVCDGPYDMTYPKFKILEKMMLLTKINDSAQMKRRTEILKIASLVDVLEKRRKGSAKEEVDKVEELSVSTSMPT